MAESQPDTCPTCHGTGFVRGEPRGHDERGEPLFVWWECDCKGEVALRKAVSESGEGK